MRTGSKKEKFLVSRPISGVVRHSGNEDVYTLGRTDLHLRYPRESVVDHTLPPSLRTSLPLLTPSPPHFLSLTHREWSENRESQCRVWEGIQRVHTVPFGTGDRSVSVTFRHFQCVSLCRRHDYYRCRGREQGTGYCPSVSVGSGLLPRQGGEGRCVVSRRPTGPLAGPRRTSTRRGT